MITFKQFLSEQDVKDMMSIEVLIRRDCAPFLEESMESGFLYRGIKGLSSAPAHSALDAKGNEMEYTIKSVRTDRKPLDTTRHRSEIIDDWFHGKFGLYARSECVFAFGENTPLSDIKHYGTPCIIFPIGPIKYVWSRRIDDLYGSMNFHHGDKYRDYVDMDDKVIAWLEDAEYTDKDLSDAVLKNHEIMIACDRYYAFPLEYKDQLKQALR